VLNSFGISLYYNIFFWYKKVQILFYLFVLISTNNCTWMVDFSYKNISSSMVILKCIGPDRFFIERAIFPQEIFSSTAPEGSQLEIWGIESYGPNLEKRLRVTASMSENQVAA